MSEQYILEIEERKVVNKHSQQGSVLLISLAILVVLTLMTFTISNTALIQDRAALNHRDITLMQQTAEAALRDAERLLKEQNFRVEDFPFEGNVGLYRGFCEVKVNLELKDLNEWINENDESEGVNQDCLFDNPNSYIRTIATEDPFDAGYWSNARSRLAVTPTPCVYGDNCPCPDIQNDNCKPGLDEAHYELGRFQVILLSVEFPFDDISDARKIVMIDNQYQSRTDTGENYFLYKIIATGTGYDSKKRQVLTSYFSALPAKSSPTP